MPTTFYNVSPYSHLHELKDQDQYEKLPIWLARQQVTKLADFQVFEKLFGNLNWKPNMGNNLRGVRAERTPIGRQNFLPKPITDESNLDVIDQEEVTNDAVLRMHDFDSLTFHFLPSFADFRSSQIAPVASEMTRQISFAQDAFLSTYLLEMAPYVFVAGKATALVDAPANTGDPGFEEADMYKNAAFWQARIAEIQGDGLPYKEIDYAINVLRDDVGAPFFEGLQKGSPEANEKIKGTYCMTGSSELFQYWKWDDDNKQLLGNDTNTKDGFKRAWGDELTFKTLRFPRRLAADGTFPAPEIATEDTNITVPNPDYVNAPYEIAYLMGADAMQALKIGPPPADFAGSGSGAGISMKKFKGMRWNGEVELTDDVLRTFQDGATTRYDTNRRRQLLQLQASLVLGAISNYSRSCMPILFARKRVRGN